MRKEIIIVASLMVALGVTQSIQNVKASDVKPQDKQVTEGVNHVFSQNKKIEKTERSVTTLDSRKNNDNENDKQETRNRTKLLSASPNPNASPSASPVEEDESNSDITHVESTLVRTKRGAQFYFDTVSNTVTLITPSGETHRLNLPWTAITNMFRLNLGSQTSNPSPYPSASPSSSPAVSPKPSITPRPSPATSPTPSSSMMPSPSPVVSPSPSATPDTSSIASPSPLPITTPLISETTNSQGDPILTQTVSQTKKFLGLIPVKVPTTITVNEITGQVDIQTSSGLARLLGFLLTN